MRPLSIVLLTASVVLLSSAAYAKPDFLETLLGTYKANAPALQARSCSNCHSSTDTYARNAYGMQIEHAMRVAGVSRLTPDTLHQVEGLDSTGDGMTNLEKIAKGLAPGEAAPETAGGAHIVAAAQRTPTVPPAPFPPKHFFHPAIVHFPIALFIVGLLLDAVGMARNQRGLLLAGWYNLLVAATSALAAVATGLTARVLTGFPLSGTMAQHAATAIAGTVVMWAMVVLRAGRHEKMGLRIRVAYYALAAAGLCLICYAGHLGGKFVYGS